MLVLRSMLYVLLILIVTFGGLNAQQLKADKHEKRNHLMPGGIIHSVTKKNGKLQRAINREKYLTRKLQDEKEKLARMTEERNRLRGEIDRMLEENIKRRKAELEDMNALKKNVKHQKEEKIDRAIEYGQKELEELKALGKELSSDWKTDK